MRAQRNTVWSKIRVDGLNPINSDAARVGGVSYDDYPATRKKRTPPRINQGPKRTAKVVCPHCRKTFSELKPHIDVHKHNLEEVKCPKCTEPREVVRSQKYFCKACKADYFVDKDGTCGIVKPKPALSEKRPKKRRNKKKKKRNKNV